MAQIGLARALAAGGQRTRAAPPTRRSTLWSAADADLPLLAAARTELAALRGRPPHAPRPPRP